MSTLNDSFGVLWHRYLGVPYTLHVYRQSTVKKATATLVFLHGIGNSGKTWDEVSAELPDDVNVVIIDLLGFGDSPRPGWAVYDAKTQARSVAKTLLSLGLFTKIILVGHSMGSLVAVEFARRYPAMVSSLVLCSPPLYNLDKADDRRLFFERDVQLRRLYEAAIEKPENILTITRLAKKAKLLNPAFDIDALSIDTYVAALKANIINQTTAHDIVRLKQPVDIVYGTLDPFVVGDNLEAVAAHGEAIRITKFIAGHEIMGRYVKKVLQVIQMQLEIGKK